MIPYTGRQKKNNGIYDYMRSAVLTRSDPVRTVASAPQTVQNREMTVHECESLIRKLAQAYKVRPHKITERRALAMLDARNEAAKREHKPLYTTVREFLTHSLISPGE